MGSSLAVTFSVDQTPEQALAAICDVRGWWSGQVDGATDALGAEFTYTVPGIHYSKFRITELSSHRVAWLVLDSVIAFVADTQEWTGTTVVFDLTAEDGRTQVRFTHEGLEPEAECYDVCSQAWGSYISGSLRSLIETGAGDPNSFEGQDAVDAVRSR